MSIPPSSVSGKEPRASRITIMSRAERGVASEKRRCKCECGQVMAKCSSNYRCALGEPCRAYPASLLQRQRRRRRRRYLLDTNFQENVAVLPARALCESRLERSEMTTRGDQPLPPVISLRRPRTSRRSLSGGRRGRRVQMRNVRGKSLTPRLSRFSRDNVRSNGSEHRLGSRSSSISRDSIERLLARAEHVGRDLRAVISSLTKRAVKERRIVPVDQSRRVAEVPWLLL